MVKSDHMTQIIWLAHLAVLAKPREQLLHPGQVDKVDLAVPELHQPGDGLRGGGQRPGCDGDQPGGQAETLLRPVIGLK